MTCEIHDRRGSAHAHVMRMIGFGPYIRNSTITTLVFLVKKQISEFAFNEERITAVGFLKYMHYYFKNKAPKGEGL